VVPSIRVTGRAVGDAAGTMQSEVTMFTGSGVQSGGNNLTRWGDYSSVTLDPTDDCTFYFTTMYLPANGEFNWRTRIASYKFPACTAPPGLSVANKSVTENNVNAGFVVTLSAASANTVTVSYATAPTSPVRAVPGADYTHTTGTLTFTPGQTTKTVNVPVLEDLVDESNETYYLKLLTSVNAIIDGQGVGTITDDDNPPDMKINNRTILEGDSGNTGFKFSIDLTAASEKTITVTYATAPGTATSGSDFTAKTPIKLTFVPGVTRKQPTINVLGDIAGEPDETFFVNLTLPTNANLIDNQGMGTIDNDD
jgi:hypothetical protein